MRAPEYTGLRGAASVWVLVSHVLLFAGVVLGAGLYIVTRSYIAVEIFFGLSVFLLLRSLDANSDKRRYFLRRVKRIWPIYFGTCILGFLLFNRDIVTFAENASFIGVYLPGAMVGPYWILWSLQIEEVMYLSFPWIHSLSPSRQIHVAGALIGVSFISGVIIYAPFGAISTYIAANVHQLPLIWLGSYGAGIFAYRGMSANLPLSVGLSSISAFPQIPFVLTVMLSFPLVLALLSHPPKLLSQKVVTIAGDNSYSMYATQLLWFDAFGWLGAIGTLITSPIVERMAQYPLSIVKPLRANEKEVIGA